MFFAERNLILVNYSLELISNPFENHLFNHFNGYFLHYNYEDILILLINALNH